MSDFDDIPVRVLREGRWQSLMIGELSFISDSEIAEWAWKNQLTAMLTTDPEWTRVGLGWRRA